MGDNLKLLALLVGAHPRPPSTTHNVGGPEVLPLSEIARICGQAAGVGTACRPYPRELQKIDIGSYYSDSSRIARELGWKPSTRFADGIRLLSTIIKRKCRITCDWSPS